jgi:hypothetical protein
LPVDARTDVFSLGALLDQLIPERDEVPIALDGIIQRALDPDASRRFPTAHALEIALDLVSIREGWLVPPSYVSAYLNDLFRSAPPEMVSAADRALPDEADSASPDAERPEASAPRAVLPRGRRGMVGVGAMLSSSHAQNDPDARQPRDHEQRATGSSLVSRVYATQTVTHIRVRR